MGVTCSVESDIWSQYTAVVISEEIVRFGMPSELYLSRELCTIAGCRRAALDGNGPIAGGGGGGGSLGPGRCWNASPDSVL